MDPTLQQLLMQFGQNRMMQPPSEQPGAPPVAYPPLGQSLMPNNGVVPTTSLTNDVGQVIGPDGNPTARYNPEPMVDNTAADPNASTTGKLASLPVPGPNMNLPGGGSVSKLLETLKGVTAPKPPDVVKPSTPHLPPIRPIESGNLVQLMASLGVSPKDIPSLKSAIGR